MRRNYNQVNFTFFRDAHDLGSSFAVNNELLDVQARTFVAFSEFRQLTLGGIFQLFGDVCNWQRFRHASVADCRHDRLDHVDADNRGAESPRERRRV